MVYNFPDKKIAEQAMLTARVDQLFFVINDYWKNFDKIVDQAKSEANKWFIVDGSKSFIFYYTLPQ